MATKSKTWIKFEDAGPSESGVTHNWAVMPIDAGPLAARIGTVRWYGPWRRYCFYAVPNAVFEQDCLRCIADFCEAKTAEHRLAKAKVK